MILRLNTNIHVFNRVGFIAIDWKFKILVIEKRYCLRFSNKQNQTNRNNQINIFLITINYICFRFVVEVA